MSGGPEFDTQADACRCPACSSPFSSGKHRAPVNRGPLASTLCDPACVNRKCHELGCVDRMALAPVSR